jgi:imidazolonepropionase-like amidohydrolase
LTVEDETWLWGGRILDPSAGLLHEHGAVRTQGGRIAEVVAASGDAPADAILLHGRTLMPGLIDAHSHVTSDVSRSPGFGPPPALHGEDPRPAELGWFVLAQAAPAFLAMGLTSVRDVGAFDDEAITLRTAIDLGLVPGPRIVSCGRILSATAPGAMHFGTMYEEADGPWEMRRAVRRQHRRGADFVKLMATGARSVAREDPEPAQMTREELAAIVDEAHRNGLRVAAHCEGLAGTRIAVEEGVDTVEHGLALHRDPELLDRMAAAGQVLVPTLTTFHDLAERFAASWVPALVEQAKRQLEESYRSLVDAHARGVQVAMGYDSGPPGANAWELVRIAEGGLGARAALVAATAGGAAALGRSDLGRLTVGSVADLLVVDGDPLADVRVLVRRSRIRLVLRDGRVVAGRDVDPVLPGAAAEPDLDQAPVGPPGPCCCRYGPTR